jgi:hypothetical protein
MGAPAFILMKNVFRFVRCAALLLAVMVAIGKPSLAQMETATLSGTVMDQSGAAVPDTQVQVTNSDTNATVMAATNKTGLYIFPALKPGRYRIVLTKQGFKQVVLTNLVLNVQDVVSRNFNLQVGAVSESISVSASGAEVQTSPAVGTVVDRRLVKELPLNGRSFQTLFQLTPGVVITSTNFSEQGQFSINGQRTDANYFMVDGVSANVGMANGFGPGQFAGGSLPALTAAGGTNGLVSTEAVQEFGIETSGYAPEFGRTPGGQVSIVTRSGTNDLHGTLSEYLRNDLFDANDWFANNKGLKRAALRQNDFGGTLGGALRKNRTFFFLSYEGLRLRQPTIGFSDVPSVASRASATPEIQPYLNSYPLPTGPDEGNGLAPADYSFSNSTRLDAGSIRIDHHFSDALSVFGRYDYAPSNGESRGGASTSRALNSVNNTEFGVHTFTLGATYIFSPHLANQLRFNWSRASAVGTFSLDNFGGAVPLTAQNVFPANVNTHTSELVFGFLNASNSDLIIGPNNDNLQRQWNVVDTFSWELPGHLLKFGMDYRRLKPSLGGANYAQIVFLNDGTSAQNGQADFTIVSSFAGPVEATFENYSVFAQDTWRPVAPLNVTYGLRWDYNPPGAARGSNGLRSVALLNTDNLSALSLAPAGTPLYRAAKNAFAPRLGISYIVRKSAGWESVVRSGFGVFYDMGNGPVGNTFAFYPFSALNTNFSPQPFPLSAGAAEPPPFGTGPPFSTILGFLPKLRQPYTYQWNFGYEQALGSKQLVTVTYLGSAAHSLLRPEDIFAPPLSSSLFTEVQLVTNGGYSNYNALQSTFRRSAAHGLEILGSYTFSHSLDNGSSDQAFSAPKQFVAERLDYGPSDFDIRHTGSVALDYELPHVRWASVGERVFSGWAVNTMLTARTAPPVDVSVLRFLSFGTYFLRPDRVLDVPLYVEDRAAPGGRRFNPNALAAPVDVQGSLPRNAFRGFQLFQMDFSVRRNFRLTEKIGLQGRLEAFNIFNHPNFGSPSRFLGTEIAPGQLLPNPTFGISQNMLNQGLQPGGSGTGFSPLYQVGGPRSLQLALKLEF